MIANEEKYTGTGRICSGADFCCSRGESVYKDCNKLDSYGKVKAMHYLSDADSQDGNKYYVRIGFKGQTQINDLMTGYGQWDYQYNVNNSRL